MATLKTKGKSFKESKGELDTLATYLTADTKKRIPSSTSIRRAWNGQSHTDLTGFPYRQPRKMAYATWKKLVATREKRKHCTRKELIEKALKMIIGAESSSNRDIAEQTGLSVTLIQNLRRKRVWVPLYDMVELEMMAGNNNDTEDGNISDSSSSSSLPIRPEDEVTETDDMKLIV